jgi:hypothetical protein
MGDDMDEMGPIDYLVVEGSALAGSPEVCGIRTGAG